MGKYFSAFLTRLTVFLEFFISIMLAVGIILLCARLAGSLIHIPDLDVYPNYDDLLAACFELIIGVELIRMMCYTPPDTVFEVLLFAIARQIIIDHTSALSSLNRRGGHRRPVRHKEVSLLRLRHAGEKHIPGLLPGAGRQQGHGLPSALHIRLRHPGIRLLRQG